MPKGVYQRSRNVIEIITKNLPDNVGRECSQETRNKIRVAHLNYWTDEKREEFSKKMKGICTRPLGYKHTEETKSKIGLANKGNVSYLKGNHLPLTIRQKISKTKRERGYSQEYRNAISKRMSGSNSPQWRGGCGYAPYPLEFSHVLKIQISNRDGNKCRLCKKSKRQNKRALPIHHIDYKKDNLMLFNLITLCDSCNSKVNAHRDYWEEYFRNLMVIT